MDAPVDTERHRRRALPGFLPVKSGGARRNISQDALGLVFRSGRIVWGFVPPSGMALAYRFAINWTISAPGGGDAALTHWSFFLHGPPRRSRRRRGEIGRVRAVAPIARG